MRSRKGFTLIELLVVIAIIAILAAILFPVFMRAKAAAMASQCQSNMNQIGKSIKMYLADWEDTFPTNKTLDYATDPPKLNAVIDEFVTLSDPNEMIDNEPIRYQNGVNWVEGVYPYSEKVAEGDAASAWKCPAVRSMPDPNGSQWANVSYSFNANLIEMPEGMIKNSGNLMMCRELDRLYDSVVRPRGQCLTSDVEPDDPFLNREDNNNPAPKLKWKLHADGSNILFADGHVKNFSISYFPETIPSGQWDGETQQWYNMVIAGTTSDPKNRAIAISP